MTRATMMLAALLLLPTLPLSVVGQVEKKRSPDRGSRFKEGDLVRINYVTFGLPDKLIIFATLEDAKRHLRERNAEAKTGRVNSLESRLYIGHNTPATIDQLDSFSVAGQEHRSAQVTFSAGPLRGQKFWVTLERLRGTREPDPAEKLISEANKRDALPPPIDPDYVPKVGDSVVLANRTLDTYSLDVSDPHGTEKKPNFWKLSPVYMVPTEPAAIENMEAAPPAEIGCFAATTSGTKAVVEMVAEAHVKIRITSGPFEGQSWFAHETNVWRPAAFAKVKSNPDALATKPKPARVMTEAEPAAQSKKRSGRRPAEPDPIPPDAKLVLTDLVVDPEASGGFVNVDGRFRNTSDAALTGMWVTISLEDRAGKLVRSQKAVCLPGTIEPGESGSFHGLVETDARVAGVKLEFSDLQKAFKWVDRSGKDAHE